MTDIGIRDISVSFRDNKISNISLVQGDALTRGFDITFVNAKGETLPVDDDYIVELVAVNSKDKDTPYACRHEVVDNKYRVMIPPEALSESGSVTIQLVFYQKSTKAVIHTIKQKCPVYQSIGQEFVESNNLYVDITALRLGLEKIEKLDSKYEEIIEKDVEIQNNETMRKEAENKRNLEEVIRQDNETIRKSNEDKREQLKTALIELKNSIESDLESINLTVDDIISSEDDRKQNEIIREEIKVELENLVADIQNKLDNGDFVGEKGEQGIQGEQGPQGPPGEVTQEEFDNFKDANSLKTAKLEKELQNYKSTMANINVNQEVKQSVSGYGSVSLPKNTANGQVSVSVKGKTLENLLGEQGLAKRNIGRTSATLVKLNLSKLMPLKTYTLYAIVSNFVGTNNAVISISSGHTVATTLKGNGIHKLILSTPVDFSNTQQLWIYFPSPSHDAGSRADIEKIMILEGDYTNRNIEYISNAKSTISASRLKSVGKNLFDKSKVIENSYFSIVNYLGVPCISWVANASQTRLFYQGKFKENTPYRITFDMAVSSYDSSLRCIYTDGSGSTSNKSFSVNSFTNLKMTSSAEKTLLGLGGMNSANQRVYVRLDTLMIEEGSTATPYEPYTETTQYLPNVGELRSLPNGVCDEVRVNGGKAEKVQRVSDTMEELAEPITTPINVSGNLISYPSGTVYIEHGTYAVGLYGENGITVTESDLPIKKINKITKIDYETGLEHELDVSKAIVSEDGLLFTHEDLEGGDIVFFDYDYSTESTQGETSIEYYDSRYVIEDTENGNFYQWKISSTNGTPNIELVDV